MIFRPFAGGVLLALFMVLGSANVARATVTTVFSDDFNRATVAGGANTYTITPTASSTGGATIISSTTLQLTNGTPNARVSVSTALTSGSGYSTTLDSCSGLVTWTFNMRYGRTAGTPSGFTSGSYGVAYVLACDNVNFAATGAKGYAVVFGNSGSPDNFNLGAFNNGLVADLNTVGSTAPAALIQGTGGFSLSTQAADNDYFSFKVTYDPATKIWTFFGRDDGTTAFADPAAGTFTTIGTFTETTAIFRTTALANMGAMWNYSTSASQFSQFDNFKLTVTSASAAPSVTSSAATSIGTTTATLNGNVTSDGGATITDRGFVYKTSAGATISDNKTTVAGTTGAYTLSPTLSVNVQYFFKAYAINSVGTTLSTPELSFWTLANTPNAPTVANPTSTSLDVTIGSGDGNPAATTYAIQEAGGSFVQANGTLGVSAIYQTASTWGTKTVTGLAPSTSYSFTVQAQNGAGTTTSFGSSAGGTTSGCTVPTAYSVTGGGAFCSGGSGVAVGLGNSDTGVNYQLVRGGSTSVGSPVSGSTGNPISFGNQTVGGAYTVVATQTAGGCTANMTGSATVTVNVVPTATVRSADATNVCAATSAAIHADLTGTGPWNVTWSDTVVQSGVSVSPATRTVSPGSTTVYTVTAVSDSLGCTPGTFSGSVTITFTSSVTPSVSVAASPGTTICPGTSVTFTATPVNGGFTPSYVWKTNGVAVTGVTGNTYTSSTLANGDTVDCQLTSGDPCASPTTANATQITMVVSASFVPSVSVGASPGTTVCSNTAVTFTATPVHGGIAPSYQWKRNGSNVGANSSTYVNSAWVNNDVITVVLTPSSDICVSPATATSSGTTMTITPTVVPSLTIAANTGVVICSGTPVTFTATPVNGGPTPHFQWKKNTVNVGTDSATYSDSSLVSSDLIDCQLTSTADCPLFATTNANPKLTMFVNSFGVANTVFSENMGTPTGTPLATVYSGWQNGSPITFTSTSSASSDVRTTSPSTGYTGGPTASASGNVFFGTAGGNDKNLIIAGINTSTLTSPVLQFGLLKAVNTTDPFVVEVSSDGTTYTALTVPQPSTTSWTWTTCSGSIPVTSNLRIRFSKNSSVAQYRLDDVKVSDIATTPTITAGGPTTICTGGSVTLTASAGSAWSWSSGQTTRAITVSPTSTTTYTVTVTGDLGCTASTSQMVTVNPLPTTSSITGSTSVHGGQAGVTYSVTDTSGSSYAWTVPSGASITAGATGPDNNSITVTFGQASGNVAVTETSAAGCVGSPVSLGVTVVVPMAASFSIGAKTGVACPVLIIGGKYPPTDSDADSAFSVVAVNYTGGHGGGVTTDGTSVTYTSANNYVGADTFTYTVSDGNGGLGVGTVTVNVTANGQGYNEIAVAGNVLTYAGIPGYNYALDNTLSLTPPVTWTPVVTNAAAANGLISFTTGGSGFYRTRYVP